MVHESGDDSHTPVPWLRTLLTSRGTPVGLGNVRAEADGVEVNHGLIAVIPLVGDDLVERPGSVTPAGASSICSAAASAVSTMWWCRRRPHPCSVTATMAPVSRSTACSALCARCVRPSFIFAMKTSAGVPPPPLRRLLLCPTATLLADRWDRNRQLWQPVAAESRSDTLA